MNIGKLSEKVIFDRRIEQGKFVRLAKDNGKFRAHCVACLLLGIADRISEQLKSRYHPIPDWPPCLYDRQTKELVRLGENPGEGLHTLIRKMLTELDLDCLTVTVDEVPFAADVMTKGDRDVN